jgi:hypothetical protein
LACGFFLDVVAFCWLLAVAAAAVPSTAVIIVIKYNDDTNNKTFQKVVIVTYKKIKGTYSQYKSAVEFYVFFIDFLVPQAVRGINFVIFLPKMSWNNFLVKIF